MCTIVGVVYIYLHAECYIALNHYSKIFVRVYKICADSNLVPYLLFGRNYQSKKRQEAGVRLVQYTLAMLHLNNRTDLIINPREHTIFHTF